MSEIYLVLEMYGRPNSDNQYPGFSYDSKKSIILSSESDWSIFKVYALRDPDSAKILCNRIQENAGKSESVILVKRNLEPTSDDLKDNENIYLVYPYREQRGLLHKDSMIFQDEINAEITKDALRKTSQYLHVMLKIPVSEKIELTKSGNLSSEPNYHDFLDGRRKVCKSF